MGRLPVLLAYIFIGSPVLLLFAPIAFGERLEARFVDWQTRLQKEAVETMLWLVGFAGSFLLVGALEYFGLFE